MFSVVFSSSLLVLAPLQEGATPPGLVLVKGGRTKIGTTVEDVEKMVLAKEELRTAIAGESPQHVVDVEDFLLMPTEVTNEQYAEFVRISKVKPPQSWADRPALETAQRTYLEEQGKAKEAAKAAGKPFESKKFDVEEWWDANWKDAKWEVPANDYDLPVVYVNYAQAMGYARWAGLRLMTEQEYQRAARGDSARIYPWGDNWDDKKLCHSLHIGKDSPMPVGSFPDGAVNGIFDLSGSVWEWTSSPFNAFPGYKAIKVKAQKRTIECLAPFDPNARVAVSGSFQSDKLGVRLTTRRPTDRDQSTGGLGFRCAASVPAPARAAGYDMARWAIERELKLAVLEGVELEPNQAAILRRWTTSPGKSKVPGYAVIQAYEHVLACPVKSVKALSPGDIASATQKDGPLFLGFIEVPRPLKEPEIDAGTYFVAFRGAGKLEEVKSDKAKEEPALPLDQIPGFTAERDCFLLYSADGTPQVALPAHPPVADKAGASTLAVVPFVPPEPGKHPKDAPAPVPLDTLHVKFVLTTASSKAKAIVFDLPLKVAPGSIDASFR